jgi:BolA protein
MDADTLRLLIAERMQALTPTALDIIDDSHLHAGHAGARGGARHYSLRIASPRFEGLSTLARHRLVYDCVRDLMPHPIHALAITASIHPEGTS